MTDRYQALRDALAAGPTPGARISKSPFGKPLEVKGKGAKWLFEEYEIFAGETLLGGLSYSTAKNGYPHVDVRSEAAANAALAAAADPETIAALLAERDALAAQLANHDRAAAALCEALNTGDGVYRP